MLPHSSAAQEQNGKCLCCTMEDLKWILTHGICNLQFNEWKIKGWAPNNFSHQESICHRRNDRHIMFVVSVIISPRNIFLLAKYYTQMVGMVHGDDGSQTWCWGAGCWAKNHPWSKVLGCRPLLTVRKIGEANFL